MNESVSDEILSTYQCNECKCIFTNNKVVDKCFYCDSNNIKQIDCDLTGLKMISFNELNCDKAINNYKKCVKYNPLVPIIFKKKNTINRISQIYMFTYLIDVGVRGNISFHSIDKDNKNKEEKNYSVMSEVNFDYVNLLINTNDKINPLEFNKVCIYDYNKIEEFRSINLDDKTIIHPNLSEQEIFVPIKKRIINTSINIVKKSIKHDLSKVEKDELEMKLDGLRKVLVPIYFLNVKYHGKNYHYLYNGVDNKYYYKLPIGIIETIVFCIIILIIFLLLGYLIVLNI